MTYSKKEFSDIIIRFINDEAGDYEWDDLLNSKGDRVYNSAISFCNSIQKLYPSDTAEYCSDKGAEKLLRLAKLLLTTDEDQIVNWMHKMKKGVSTPERAINR